MLAQLPLEIIDQVIESLSFKDIGAIACVCSALRQPAQLRLFRTISIRNVVETGDTTPSHNKIVLPHPNLLQYASRLVVEEPHVFIGDQRVISSIHSLWPHFPTMYRLTYVELALGRSNHAVALSTLEGLGLTREIELNLMHPLTPDLVFSDKPLPVRSLSIPVNIASDQVTRRLLQKCSQSLRKLHLSPQMNRVPSLPPLPQLCELSLCGKFGGSDLELAIWFPFLDQHPTITRLSMDAQYTLAVPTPPNILPNLQSLESTTMVSQHLIPGRPVHDLRAKYYFDTSPQYPVEDMFQVLRLSNVPLTILEISTYHTLQCEGLIKILKTVPKLRKFTLNKPHYNVCQLLKAGVFKSD